MAKLISFDIDGTMFFGEPAGKIALEKVLEEKANGHWVGSASDRTLREQQRLWDLHGFQPDFISQKHRLEEIRDRFPAEEYWHIGDTEQDRMLARMAGFRFCWVDEYARNGGILIERDGTIINGASQPQL